MAARWTCGGWAEFQVFLSEGFRVLCFLGCRLFGLSHRSWLNPQEADAPWAVRFSVAVFSPAAGRGEAAAPRPIRRSQGKVPRGLAQVFAGVRRHREII
jgi:hypothetical protein